jgi:hypothetical protein
MWATRQLPSLFLPSALVLLLLLPERADAAAMSCGEPDVPCEMPFVESCLVLLTQGVVKTTDLLRDDTETDGCILCVPPGGSYTGPNPCPTCECMEGEAVCFGLAGLYLSANEGSGVCPPSDYADFTDFTVETPVCPTAEGLDCGGDGVDSPMPTCDGEPGVPCEIPFATRCIDLLTSGELDISDILRDDESTGGCILCIPPGGFSEGPEACPTCECNGSEIECAAIGTALMFVSTDAGECPPSEYANRTDITVVPKSPCKGFEELELELDCGGGTMDIEPVGIKEAKPEKQEQDKPEKQGKDKPEKQEQDKPDKASNEPDKLDKPAKQPKGRKSKGERN